jgi:hypothetical protein
MAARRRTVPFRMFSLAAALVAVSCTGSTGDASPPASASASASTRASAPAPDPLAGVAAALAPGGAYRVVPVMHPGAIAGRIRVDKRPARHDTTLTGDDASVCGARVPDRSVEGYGHWLQGVLVWVSDVRAGQALPRVRRADLQISRCQFVPRVLALAQGTTINLQSKDNTEHRTRFYSESADSLLSRLVTVDRWAVVPTARIAVDPGLVRVRLTRHPFIRGFVAVFPHPYFAVTNRYGRYRIPGLPAGTYHVRVWHERGGDPVERVVTVKPGLQATFDTTLVLH